MIDGSTSSAEREAGVGSRLPLSKGCTVEGSVMGGGGGGGCGGQNPLGCVVNTLLSLLLKLVL